MQKLRTSSTWWGAPKKFDRPQEERSVSWLELFYDLVYVIAISRITHHFSLHVSTESFFEYAFLFILIFWGWVNGSLYHDMHGNEGLRTRLMTLWQMVIVAALAVVIEQSHGYFSITIVFMIMQFYITYMWWSIGFYDKSHRRYNLPYTVFYLIALALMGASLLLPKDWLKLLVPIILLCNYAPPFVAQIILRRNAENLNLSSSMFERLGLLAIIVFGEVVLGVINGIGKIETPDFKSWLDFILAISIVFSLWWIFFTLVAQREAKKGFRNGTFMEVLYIPTLLSLGLIAVSFSSFFDVHNEIPVQKLGYAMATFLACVSLMLELLVFPDQLKVIKRPAQISLILTAFVFLVSALIEIYFNKLYYLIGILAVLLIEITYMNSKYYRMTK